MDKKTFDLLDEYKNEENKLYFRLIEEEKMDMEKADNLVEGFTDLYERILKIGKYLDEDMYIGKETYLIKKYEDFEAYLKLNVIYIYENGMALCETTTMLIQLIPVKYLANIETDFN